MSIRRFSDLPTCRKQPYDSARKKRVSDHGAIGKSESLDVPRGETVRGADLLERLRSRFARFGTG